MKIQSRLKGTTTVMTLVNEDGSGAEEVLTLQVEIGCPLCGDHVVVFAGHHLRALRNLLLDTIDQHPALCGEEAGIAVVNRLKFGGEVPPDPTMN
jgi:hypothetical protein